MQQERLIKRGRLAELEDEQRNIEAKARGYIQTLRNTLDHPENLPHMDLEMVLVLVREMSYMQGRMKKVFLEISLLRKELGL